MRKRLILRAFVFIGFASLAVLGSSQNLWYDFLEATRNSQILPTIVRSSGIDSEQALQETAINSSEPTSSTKADGQADEIPETVLWSVIFSLPSRLDHKAEQARSAGENDSLWTDISSAKRRFLQPAQTLYDDRQAPTSQRSRQ